jgi:hypothetical protein
MRLEKPLSASGPERWSIDVGAHDVAQLDIPPHARRDRRFEVFCSLQVACAADAGDAWHGLRVLVNGAQHWARRVTTHPGGLDSLDYRFVHTVPVGDALRLVATSQVHRAVRKTLSITAEEELPD